MLSDEPIKGFSMRVHPLYENSRQGAEEVQRIVERSHPYDPITCWVISFLWPSEIRPSGSEDGYDIDEQDYAKDFHVGI